MPARPRHVSPDRPRTAHARAPVLARVAGALIACALCATAHAAPDPNHTVTLYVPGFELSGADRHGVFGEPLQDAVADSIANLVALPVVRTESGPIAPDAVSGTDYYGDTAPGYYSAADRAALDQITAQYGGGVPRYAFIVARYARRLLERSGAGQVNIVSASFGSLIARWMIEQDVGGLASQGRIARWLSVEGLVAGSWVASQGLTALLASIAPEPIDVQHMRYDWIETHLHAPRGEAASPLYGDILIGGIASTDDRGNSGALRDAMLVANAYQPNDGTQALPDARFSTVAAAARYQGLAPTLAVFHVDHLAIRGSREAWADAGTFLIASRRVTVTLTSARVLDLHEPQQPWWDWRPAECLFESRVYSPAAAARWAVTGPLCAWIKEGAAVPLRRYRSNGETQSFSQVLFDDLVLPEESELTLALTGTEIDYDPRYGVVETAQTPYYDDLGATTLRVSARQPGSYAFTAGDWSGTISVAIHDYPFAAYTAVPPPAPPAGAARLTLAPNPARGAVRIVAAGAGASDEEATLEIVDVAGRIVRRMRGPLHAGFVWDGRDAAGRPAAAGVFVARVRTARGVMTARGCLLP